MRNDGDDNYGDKVEKADGKVGKKGQEDEEIEMPLF